MVSEFYEVYSHLYHVTIVKYNPGATPLPRARLCQKWRGLVFCGVSKWSATAGYRRAIALVAIIYCADERDCTSSVVSTSTRPKGFTDLKNPSAMPTHASPLPIFPAWASITLIRTFPVLIPRHQKDPKTHQFNTLCQKPIDTI